MLREINQDRKPGNLKMSSTSGVSSKTPHQFSSSAPGAPPNAASNGMGPAMIGSSFVLDHGSNPKALAAELSPPPVKEHFNASFGAFIGGHYTDF
jgi:hypothetical protein